MKKIIYLLLIIQIANLGFSKNKLNDSLKINTLEYRVEQIDNQLKEVRRDELNYKIEKDLLKETYQNNYERINLLITLILGIIGVLGYVGLKDINTIKKEYISELTNLKNLQTNVSSKFKEFETSKEKYDTELRDILKTNDEQNKKIKVLELKDKISSLFKEEQYLSALEFCIVALELSPNDINLLFQKARIFTRTRSYKDSISTYHKILELDKENNVAIFDLAEVYLLNKQKEEFDKTIKDNNNLFLDKIDGELLDIFAIITAYQEKNIEKLKEFVLAKIDNSDMDSRRSRIDGWDFKDILIYLVNEPETEERVIAQNLMWYLDGQLSATNFCKRTKIEIESRKDTTENS